MSHLTIGFLTQPVPRSQTLTNGDSEYPGDELGERRGGLYFKAEWRWYSSILYLLTYNIIDTNSSFWYVCLTICRCRSWNKSIRIVTSSHSISVVHRPKFRQILLQNQRKWRPCNYFGGSEILLVDSNNSSWVIKVSFVISYTCCPLLSTANH